MSTSRQYHIFSFHSRIIPGLYYASVTNKSKTRIVHETSLYDDPLFAKQAAEEWAEKSHSKKAKSLEKRVQGKTPGV